MTERTTVQMALTNMNAVYNLLWSRILFFFIFLLLTCRTDADHFRSHRCFSAIIQLAFRLTFCSEQSCHWVALKLSQSDVTVLSSLWLPHHLHFVTTFVAFDILKHSSAFCVVCFKNVFCLKADWQFCPHRQSALYKCGVPCTQKPKRWPLKNK